MINQTKSMIMNLGDLVAHGIDAVNNFMQGNYQFAVCETITSIGIEVSNYLGRRRQRAINDFCERVPVYVAEANRISEESERRFQDLFDKLD